jgi:hypothetical protein
MASTFPVVTRVGVGTLNRSKGIGTPPSMDRDIYSVEHRVQQGQQANAPANVATGLDALGHDQVAAGVRSRFGLLDRTDLPAGQGATSLGQLDKLGVGIAVEELDHACPGSRDLDGLAVEEGHQEVDAERAARPLAKCVEDLGQERGG